MYCKKCGNMQKNGEKFCPKCGTPYLSVTNNHLSNSGKTLVDNDSEFESNQNSEESPRQEFTNNNPNQGAKEILIVDGKPSEELGSAEKKSSKKIIYTILGLLVLGGLCYYLSGNIVTTKILGSSVQEDFVESIKLSSTAYSTFIYKEMVSGIMSFTREVPKEEGDMDYSFEWTFLFFPESDNFGRVTVEAWRIDSDAWSNSRTQRYQYEIRDNIIELFNGSMNGVPHPNSPSGRIDDVRLIIERENNEIQLRGVFLDKERIFKKTVFRGNKMEHRN